MSDLLSQECQVKKKRIIKPLVEALQDKLWVAALEDDEESE